MDEDLDLTFLEDGRSGFDDFYPLNNYSQSFSILLLYDSTQRKWRGSLMIVMCILSLPLNCLLFWQTRERNLATSCGNHQILQHLSVANCVTAVFCLLTKGIWEIVVEWYLGDTMCKVVNGLEKFSLYANTYLVVALSIQRVINFTSSNTRTSATKKRSRYLTIGAWSLSSVCAIPQVFGHSAQVDQMANITVCQCDYHYYGEHSMWANDLEAYVHVILLYFLPVTMIITSSVILSCAILKRMKRFGLARDDFSGAANFEAESAAIFATQTRNSRSTSADSMRSTGKVLFKKQRLSEIVLVTRYCCHGHCDHLHYAQPRLVSLPTASAAMSVPYRQTSNSSGNVSGADINDLAGFSIARQRASHSTMATDETPHSTAIFQRAKLRSVQVAVTTVGFYVLCWTPYYLFQLVLLVSPHTESMGIETWDIAAWLNIIGYVYIIVHPLLYGAVSVRNIRRRVRKLYIGRRRKRATTSLQL